MGSCCAKSSEIKVVLIGLDQAGKTSLLNAVKYGEMGQTKPTVGFNFETVKHKGVDVNIWDTGGADKIRDLWKHYYEEVDGVVFVCDVTSSEERLKEARDALHLALRDQNLTGKFVAVVGNKSDDWPPSEDAKPSLARSLDLAAVPGSSTRTANVVLCSAAKRHNLDELLDWIAARRSAS